MRVLHVIPAVAPRYGGPSEAIVHMLRALRAAGVAVLLATTDADGPGGRLDVPLGVEHEWRGVPAIFFGRLGGEAAKSSPAFVGWLARRVREFDLLHIHAVFSFTTVAAAALAGAFGVPYVVRPLGTLDPWSLAQKPLRKRIALRLGGRRMLSAAAAIHYTSPRERRSAEAALGLERGIVVPLGVDPELLTGPPAAPPEGPYVLALGRLHPKKNLPLLVDAFARACAAPGVPGSARLVIAGDGPPEFVAELERRAAERGIRPRVEFVGWVGGERKRALLAGARAVAMLSSQENFGISAVEALALGVPLVVAEQVDLADDVRRVGCGWVVPSTAEAAALALSSALEDASEAARRGRAGGAWARAEFTWDRIAGLWVELYRTISGST